MRIPTLRSHYLFESVFCQPGIKGAHEKGGIENSVGYFRRNYLSPVPSFQDIEALNQYLYDCCQKDMKRTVQGCQEPIEALWMKEQPSLKPLPKQAFSIDEIRQSCVNDKSLVSVHGNQYSVPCHLVGLMVEVRIGCYQVVCYERGQLVAQHKRNYEHQHIIMDIQHYISLLRYKPGAFKHSLALHQSRQHHAWPSQYDDYWNALKQRLGDGEGTKQFLELLWQAREVPAPIVLDAIEQSLTSGAISLDSILMLMRQQIEGPDKHVKPLQLEQALSKFDRPPSHVADYDELLQQAGDKLCPTSIH